MLMMMMIIMRLMMVFITMILIMCTANLFFPIPPILPLFLQVSELGLK